MNNASPAHYVFLFPRKRNAERIQAAARSHLPAEKIVTFQDQTKFLEALRNTPDILQILRWTEGRVHAVIDVPVVKNFQITWEVILTFLRATEFQADIHIGFIIDREVAYTRQLRNEAQGKRFDFTSDAELDPDFHDPDGPRLVTGEVRRWAPGSPIIETTDNDLETDLEELMEEMRTRRWRYEKEFR